MQEDGKIQAKSRLELMIIYQSQFLSVICFFFFFKETEVLMKLFLFYYDYF